MTTARPQLATGPAVFTPSYANTLTRITHLIKISPVVRTGEVTNKNVTCHKLLMFFFKFHWGDHGEIMGEVTNENVLAINY
jgi:hypothetical protein